MTATTVPTTCPDTLIKTADDGASSPAAAFRTATLVASALWVFVGGLLAYGIVQTAIKAAALFG